MTFNKMGNDIVSLDLVGSLIAQVNQTFLINDTLLENIYNFIIRKYVLFTRVAQIFIYLCFLTMIKVIK